MNDDDEDFFIDALKTLLGMVIVALLGVAVVHIVWEFLA